MTLERVPPAELLPTSSNHLFTVVNVGSRVVRDVVHCSRFGGYTAAHPLRGSLETRVCADMSFKIRGTMIALNPLAIGTCPWVGFVCEAGNTAGDGLRVSWKGGRARSLGGRRYVLGGDIGGNMGRHTGMTRGATTFLRITRR